MISHLQGLQDGLDSAKLFLFRLARYDEGSILIDNVNIKDVGLQALRKSISWIPKNPTLFAGTVMENIDPFNETPISTIIQILKEINLKNLVDSLAYGIDT